MILATDPFDVDTVFHYLNTTGVIGLLILILLGGAKKWWVFGWQYKDLEERLDKVETSNAMWMQLALRGVNVTEQVIKSVASPDEK